MTNQPEDEPDNPQAFACSRGGMSYQLGMTLLDYFAGQIIAACIGSDKQCIGAMEVAKEDNRAYEDVLADGAYCIAEAMLKEREKRGTP